jgi:hypothetical protein
VTFLALSVLAGVLVVVGLATANVRCVAAGLLALPLAWAVRAWLVHSAREVLRAAETLLGGSSAAPNGPPLDALVALLREWEALERRRGTPGFDPWALLSLRREIQRTVDESPALSRLMHG